MSAQAGTFINPAADHAHMQRALALAGQARPVCPPNPAVGCVLVAADGRVIGQGHTQPVGQAHAEVMALRDAAAHGQPTAGATAYVTLEPCSHHGRTGPCCDALAAAGIARVVVAVQDPNPRVAGRGMARLRAAGVRVDVCDDGAGHAAASRELNIGFFQRMLHGRPWVRLKAACSLDGRTALPNGQSRWITSAEARADGHVWRARACAVLTGVGTVLADDPLLNVRLPDESGGTHRHDASGSTHRHDATGGTRQPGVPSGVRQPGAPSGVRQPALVLADSRLRTPAGARLFSVADRAVWVYAASAEGARAEALRACGADVRSLPDARGQLDLPALLADLARREVNELHVEAGAQLNGALLAQALVDELLLYQAPLLLGEGRPLAALGPFAQVAQGLRPRLHDMRRVGADVRSQWRFAHGGRGAGLAPQAESA